MSKHQAFKDAIEVFQPGGADAPILYSTTEMNEKGFVALLGRKLKWYWSAPITITIIAITIIATSAVVAIIGGTPQATPIAVFIPMFVIIFLYRTTLVAVNGNSLDFYFIDAKLGSKYVVYDKINLPFDKITNVKVKIGKVFKNTHFTFEFLHEGKNYKIKTTIPNKMKKMKEQEENLKCLLEVLEKI